MWDIHTADSLDLFVLKDDGDEHPMFIRPPSTLKPNTSLAGSKEQAVETWTLARKEFVEHLSALTPGEQLYFTTAFISDETGYGYGFGPRYGSSAPVLPSLLLQCLIGEGSTPLAALKKWMADHPAEGTVEIHTGEHRSPLYALLIATISIMDGCAADGYAQGWSEISSATALLMDAGAPLYATSDKVAKTKKRGRGDRGYNTTNGVIRLCRELAQFADAFTVGCDDGPQLDLAEICRSFIAKIPAAER